ncbi:acyl carrier protein (plasmid) [Streptomyces sp. NBC_00536]|uniref:acyl carrier protein n=1 Tax=Streptomyces sp. NBC_00536 TaxID=2975769 RepID=UPI002E81A95D|nr:acyl carrier protein [Streptomyces sp. NBC_00536]WUC84267.1 acyl carrier protein [Streptomyces sp. NBC_00536]
MTTAPHTPAADVLAELTAVLAGMTGAEVHSVDAERPFAFLGIDSLLSAQFVAALGARYGIRLPSDALYEHRTPAALARHIAGRLHAPSAPAPSAATTSWSPLRPVRDPAAVAVAADPAGLTLVLRDQLARILRCAPEAIDPGTPFTMLGLDSILAAEFVAGINQTWDLTEQTALLYEHPDLAAMAAYVTSRVTGTPAVPPAPAAPTPPAAQGPGLDLEALLDAVRDDVLSIDEAAALLAAR